MIRHVAAAILLIGVTSSAGSSAHCDTTQGPVVTAARSALGAGDVNLVLHWVRPGDENTVREAFRRTLEVRRLGSEAMALADRSFFETVVRVHRAGEGAPYEGITDAPAEPIIAATDRALESGSTDELEQELVTAVRTGLAERFAAARAKKSFRPGDVAGGRAYVSAYVPLTHWVEAVFTTASRSGEHHAAPDPHTAGAHPKDEHGATPERDVRHGTGSPSGSSHSDQHLPWLLVALFAVAASVEALFLMRRQRRVTV